MAFEQFLPSLLSAFFSFAIGTFVLFKGKKEKKKILFSIFCYGLFIQALFAGFLYIADNELGALHLDLMSVVGIIIAISSFVHFTVEFNDVKKFKKKILIVNYIIAFFFFFYTFTGKIFSSVVTEKNGYAGVPGSMYGLFTVYLFFALIFCLLVFIFYLFAAKDNEHKNRIKYILISTLILGITALLDMLRKSGIALMNINIDLTRFGILFFLLGISYTIIKYKMLDINFVLKKSIAVGIAMVISAMIYMILQNIFQKYLYQVLKGSGSLIAALIIAMSFDYIKNKTTWILGIVFYYLFKKEVKRKKGRKNKLIKQVEKEIKGK